MNQPLLTVCITTYNRPEITCDLLKNLYFDTQVEYILVDDGSLPEYIEIVEEFIKEHKLSVVYLTKENGGKLSALRLGLSHANGKYFTDLDSDDKMEKSHICNILEGIRKADHMRDTGTPVIGICGLSETPTGVIFGDEFPAGLQIESYIKMRLDYKIWGNKVEVILTKVLQEISIDFFKGETRVPTNILWFSLESHPLLFINAPFERYTPSRTGSISSNLRAIQTASPNSTRSYFKVIFQKKKYYKSVLPYLSAILNYQRFSWHGARPFFESELSKKEHFLIALSIPFGFLLYCWDKLCLGLQRG
jgi:glycosyltransferase involved in cell wall biosynthesis